MLFCQFSNDCTVGICSNCTYVHVDTCELATYKLTSMHSNTVNTYIAKMLKVSKVYWNNIFVTALVA